MLVFLIFASESERCVMSQKDLVVDSVGGLSVNGALVRLELLGLVQLPKEGEAPEYSVEHRLVMSLETMLRMHAALSQVVTEMTNKGVLKKKE